MIERMPNFKTKLLVVDDEPAIVEIISKMLSDHGYDTRNAYDGDEAVSIAKEFRPDCIVTGVMMPKMGGLQEATAILQFQPTCKFVFVTGCANRADFREYYEQQGWDAKLLLGKPFEAADLLKALSIAGFPVP
jgi:two-component system, OmpR family, response regulator SaeR